LFNKSHAKPSVSPIFHLDPNPPCFFGHKQALAYSIDPPAVVIIAYTY
jgi:hypothetical protein